MGSCTHRRMVPSDVTTDEEFPRVYSHCPACKGDFHPDSPEVVGQDSIVPDPPIPE